MKRKCFNCGGIVRKLKADNGEGFFYLCRCKDCGYEDIAVTGEC